MKVITVTKEERNSISERINIQFINQLAKKLGDSYKCVPIYNKKELKMGPEEFYGKYKPDIVICHEHSKFFDDGFFNKMPCLKVMIAVDFWKLFRWKKNKDRKFYENNKFDLVFHRHWASEEEKRLIPAPTVWLPWAVSPKEFYPKKEKINRIAFIGTRKPEWIYWQRDEAFKRLSRTQLFNDLGKINGEGYPKALRSYSGILNSAELDSPFGKFFEIIASGSVPLTAPFQGKEILFDKECMIEYKPDCSDVVEKAYELILNEDKTEKLAENGYNEFIEKHTYEKRINELYNNLVRLYKNKPLKRKWKNE